MIGAIFGRLRGFQLGLPHDLEPAVARTLEILARFPHDNPDPVLCITAEGRLAQSNPASQPLLVDWQTSEGQLAPEWLQQEVRATLQTAAPRRLERACAQSYYELTLVPLPQYQLVNLYGRDITRWRAAEQQLRDREERTHLILDAVPDCIKVVDEELRVIEINAAGLAFLEAESLEQVIGLTCTDRIHTEDRVAFDELHRAAFRGEAGQLTFRMSGLKGTPRWMETKTVPLRNEQGAIHAAIGITRDITGLIEKADELRASENRYRGYVDSAPHGVFLLDEIGRLVDVNPIACQVTGYTRAELLQLKFTDLLPPDALAPGQQALEELRSRGSFQVELPFIDKGGRYGWSALHAVKLDDNHYLTYATNITARRSAEEELRRERDFTRHILDTAPVIILLLDQQGNIQYINPYFEQVTGWRLAEIQGQDWIGMFLPAQDQERIRSLFMTAARGTPTRSNINSIVTRQGAVREIEWNDQTICDADGQMVSLLCIGVDVTERQRIEQALRQSEEQLRLSLQATGQGFYDLDLATGDVHVSREYATMLGYDPTSFQETVAKSVGRMHPDDRERVLATFDAFVRDANPLYEVEFRQQTSAGEWMWIASVGSIVARDADGKPLRVIGTRMNIDARKRAEKSLRASERRLKEAQRIAHIGNWELTLATMTLIWSDEIFRIFEVDPARCSASYELFVSKVHPDDRQMVHLAYVESVESRQPYDIIHRILLSGDRIRFVRERCETHYDATGQALRSIGTVQDVTDVVLTERALRTSESRLKEAHQLAALGAWELDLTSQASWWSEEQYRLNGVAPDTPITQAFFLGMIHEEDRAAFEASYNLLFSQQRVELDYRIVRPDGSVRYMRGIASLICDAQGRPSLIRGTNLDVTERKRAEEHTRRLRDELAHVTRLGTLGELAAGLAHELSQPLGAIALQASVALQQVASSGDEQLAHCVRKISDQSLRAGEIIRRLRSMVKRRPSYREKCNINDLLLEVLRLQDGELRFSRVTCQLDLASELPTVSVDSVQIQQVFLNLIRNAIEAMSAPNVRERVLTITTQRCDSGVRASVRDTGGGIAPELRPSLFEPFQTTKAEGLGIGLSVSRTLIEAHRGKLWAIIEETTPTTFVVELPLSEFNV